MSVSELGTIDYVHSLEVGLNVLLLELEQDGKGVRFRDPIH
jgi:hypothetical protein